MPPFFVKDNGDEGFLYPLDVSSCTECGFLIGRCLFERGAEHEYYQEDGGVPNGGRCYAFDSLDDLWMEFGDTHAINPDTGEVFAL